LRVVHPHGDDVARPAVAEVRRELVAEGAVAIRPLPEVMPVDPDLAVTVGAVELDEHQPARVPLGYGERLAVPPHPAGQRPAAGAARSHGRPATLMVRRSRMSADEAPTAISTGSFSTTQRWASGLQYASVDAASGNATVRVSPGPSVRRL